MDAVDDDERVADVIGLDDIALVDQQVARASVDGRPDLGVAELEAGVLHGRLVRLDDGAGRVDGRAGRLDRRRQALLVRAHLIVLLARHEAALGQALVAVLLDAGVLVLRRIPHEVGLCLRDLGLVLGELGLRLLELRLEGARVDREQEIADLDLLPFGEVDPQQLAADQRQHGDRRVCLDIADRPELDRHVPDHHLARHHRHRGRARRRLGGGRIGAAVSAGAEGEGDHAEPEPERRQAPRLSASNPWRHR